MIDTIHTFEDIISKEKQDVLEKYFSNPQLDWKDINNTTILDSNLPQKVLPSKFIKNSDIKSIISDIEENVALRIGTSIKKNYRYKVNLLTSDDYLESRNEKESIHIDRYEPHVSMVYYINNSIGDTKFYKLNDGNIIDWGRYVVDGEYSRFVEFKSVSPKKGKIVVFDGLIPHHSTYPKIGNRYVINFNTVINLEPKTLF